MLYFINEIYVSYNFYYVLLQLKLAVHMMLILWRTVSKELSTF